MDGVVALGLAKAAARTTGDARYTRQAEGRFIPAEAFSALSGSPTRNDTTQFSLWQLNGLTSQVIRTVQDLQLPWSLVDIDLLWTNLTAVSGTVQLRLDVATLLDGSSISSLANIQTLYLTEKAPAQNVVEVTNIASAVSVTSGINRLLIRTTGTGTLGNNNIGVIGLRIRPSIVLDATRVTSTPLPGLLKNNHNQNGAAFIRDNVVTAGTTQYAVWVNDSGNPVIGKRTVGSSTWSIFDLSTVSGNPLAAPTVDDGHNNYVLGVDSDGYLHVSGNHHDNPLRIVRSTNPGDITGWVLDSTAGIPSANINSTSYPQMITGPDGALWLWTRQGGSGNGAMFLHKYDTAAKRWNYVARPITGFTTDGATTDQSPYINTPVIDANGIWHVFFMWRTTDDLATTHDFGYIRSTDATALHWQTATGVGVGDQTKPQDTAPLLWTGFYDQINQAGAAVDVNNRAHACMWIRVNNTGANNASAPSVLRHYYFDGTAWQADDEVYAAGASPTFRSRPQLLSYGGKVFVLYADWPVIGVTPGAVAPRSFTRWWLRDITTGSAPRLRPFVFLTEDVGNNEFPYDHRAAETAGKLNILVTRTGSNGATSGGDTGTSAYASMPGRIITLDLAGIIANPPI